MKLLTTHPSPSFFHRLPSTVYRLLLLLPFTYFFTPINAQAPEPQSSTEIFQQLKKLSVLGSVLYIAAHPDDENNSFLPYLAKEKNYRTAYLSLTRGDGGQNLIGPEQGIELGLIRTQELLAARRIDGAEQYFTSAYEFGFSKTADETLRYWNREKVLADIVWVIRKFQPDIIINRFPPDSRAGHAHHTSSSILSIEAYKAAADSTRFPEQLELGVDIWQAKRLLWNTYNFGGANTTSETQLKIDGGVYNSLMGKSYGEIGGEARSMHKSQGEGRPHRKGPIYEYFSTIGGDTAKTGLMDGIITDWTRIPTDGVALQQMVNKIVSAYNFEHPELSVAPLIELYKAIQRIDYKGIWWTQKKEEIQNLIINCAGVFAEATTDVEYAVAGEKLAVNLFMNKRSNANLQLDQILLNTSPANSFDTSLQLNLLPNTNFSLVKNFTVETGKPYSQPYWLANPMADMGTFSVTDQQLVGKAESAPPFIATFVFSMNGISFNIYKPVQCKYVDAVRGEVYQPLNVITPVIVFLNKDVILTNVVENGKLKQSIAPLVVQFKANFSATALPIKLNIKEGDEILYSRDSVLNLEQGGVYSFPLALNKITAQKLPTHFSAEIAYTINGKQFAYTHYLKSIKYDHIPTINYFYKDNVVLVNEKINTVAKKVGYIIGAGDLVPEALEQLGYAVDYLREQDITDEKLKKYQVIMVGIRAHNIHEWLTNKNDIISRYVQNGGHYVVQYLKGNTIGNKRVKVGPYPFAMTNTRVTEEKAKVSFLTPNHPFLSFPNKITDDDFDGWVQERSTYQLEPVQAPYEAVLSMGDKGEKQTNGSLVTAKYGKGNFTYVSLVLFRQLPAGVPGAYRLLANIIGLPVNK